MTTKDILKLIQEVEESLLRIEKEILSIKKELYYLEKRTQLFEEKGHTPTQEELDDLFREK